MKTSAKNRQPLGCRIGLVALAVGLSCWLGCRPAETPEATKPTEQPAAGVSSAINGQPIAEQSNAAEQATAQGVLDAMVEAYKTAQSYADFGQARMTGQIGDQPFDVKASFLMAMVRPNKIRLQAYDGIAVCDGEHLRAYVEGIPNRVLEVPSPETLKIDSIFAHGILADRMAQGPTQEYTWLPLQVILLLADDPLKTLLYQATEVQLLPPEPIEEQLCDRVEITRPDGKGVFWIDRETHVLRRFEYPTDELKRRLAADQRMGRVDRLTLVADFTSATLNQPVDPAAFQIEIPPEKIIVDALTPPGIPLLGKPSRDFYFVGEDNRPVTMKSLEGKVVLLSFWASWGTTCPDWLPELQKAYDKFKDNDQVVFLAVSIDAPNVPDEELKSLFRQWNVDLPLGRDPDGHNEEAFDVTDIPTTVILGRKSVVQAVEPGGPIEGAAELIRQIDKLLANEDIFTEKLEVYEVMKSEYRRIFDEMLKQDLFVSPMAILQQIPQSGVAEESSAAKLKLTPLWENTDLDMPGNILLVPRPDGPDRLLVVHGGKAVAELDPHGALVTNHPLELPEPEFVAFVRTHAAADGQRVYVGSAPGMQQFHVFDESWKRLHSFPSDAHDHPHAGIGDVQIADLDGNGMPEVAVGYRGLVGVKGVSLDGTILWSERSLSHVLKMAVGAPDADGRRLLFCTNDRNSLAMIDADGNQAGRVSLGGRLLYWITTADLDGDGQMEMCGLSAPQIGGNLAMGLNTQGDLLWSYELPEGTPGQMVELVTTAQLSPNGSAQWLLAGVDGSIHIVASDGSPIDRFNHGMLITGLAATSIDNKPAILISTRQGVTALAVEWPTP